VPNVIQPLQSGVQSVAAGVATAVPGVVSTAISDLNSFEASIPHNVSLGTKKFCVGFADKTPSCSELPLNLSTIIPPIPTAVENYLHLDFNVVIGPLNSALAKITPAYIYDSLISGLVLILVMVVVLSSMSLPMKCLSAIPGFKILRVGLPLLLGIICFTRLMITVVILGILDAKTKNLPSWIHIEYGEVTKLAHWSLSNAIIAMVVSTILPIVL
jgi:hypothetical protein